MSDREMLYNAVTNLLVNGLKNSYNVYHSIRETSTSD